MKSLSRVRLFATPWTAAYQAPPSMGFSRPRILEWVAIAFSIPGGLVIKNLAVMLEIWVRSLGGEDPLEEDTAAHSSILAWRISWTEEPSEPQSMGLQSRTRLSD